MTKRFEEFLNPKQESKTPEVEGITIDGAFGCQTCHYQCDEAIWNPDKQTLTWKCPDGHNSVIRDFKGF